MSLSDGDVWESDFESTMSVPSKQDETAEIRKLRLIHQKRGYLDGITSAKEENLQSGFDETYGIGSKFGNRIGIVLGGLYVLATLHGERDDALKRDLAQAQRDLRINKTLSKQHFDENCDMREESDPVSAWENVLVQYQRKYAQ
ncbi:LADA_0H18624g1_1 [Lachancea dasiensis]|uniref:Protein YAE1 n=1 Tax=Lachancea dasiensis TaxID=1072105 RepID=A0A1G4K5Z6_9SACH|nr:LADA_0H18624g1_1 [Lachancea dasiensis]